MTTAPLMKKATAVWLIENTQLSFEQIADFCQLHRLEVQAIADGEVAGKMYGLNPLLNGQLTKEEIQRCEKDTNARLTSVTKDLPKVSKRAHGPKYTPISKRQEKPDAIAWILKNTPELTDAQIVRLIGTTKNTIDKIRNRSHWNIQNIKAQNPVSLGLCSQEDLEAAVKRAQKKEDKKNQAKNSPSTSNEPEASENTNPSSSLDEAKTA